MKTIGRVLGNKIVLVLDKDKNEESESGLILKTASDSNKSLQRGQVLLAGQDAIKLGIRPKLDYITVGVYSGIPDDLMGNKILIIDTDDILYLEDVK